MKKMVSIVAPMYNEEALCEEYCKETLAMTKELKDRYNFEVILVNDGSKDNTYERMLEQQKKYPEEITVVCLSRNFGLEGAVNAGISKAVGDAVVVMDADLQDPPKLIPEMIEKWEQGADIVVGSRVKRSNDKFLKKLGAGFYYKVLDSLSGKLKLEQSAANFRLLSRKAVDQILSLPEVNSVFRVVVPFVGMKTDIVEYDRDKRFAGKTKYSLKSMIPYALDSITGISIEPLRKTWYFIVLLGLLFVLSLIFAIITTGMWQPMWCVIMALVGVGEINMIVLTIVSQYLSQVFLEVKGRPISIVYEYIPSNNAKEKSSGIY